MNGERSEAPKEEIAQGQAAPKSKEKRVAPYFLPNLVVAALVAITVIRPRFWRRPFRSSGSFLERFPC